MTNRNQLDQDVIVGCLDRIDKCLITLENYQDVMTKEEQILLLWLKNSHFMMDKFVKTGLITIDSEETMTENWVFIHRGINDQKV